MQAIDRIAALVERYVPDESKVQVVQMVNAMAQVQGPETLETMADDLEAAVACMSRNDEAGLAAVSLKYGVPPEVLAQLLSAQNTVSAT